MIPLSSEVERITKIMQKPAMTMTKAEREFVVYRIIAADRLAHRIETMHPTIELSPEAKDHLETMVAEYRRIKL